jgi:hypothetical protein
MNIVITHNQYNNNNIYFNEPIQNTIMDNSKFIKILYSNENIMLNGIFLLMPIKNNICENYFKKIKVSYDINYNREILLHIYNIEHNILSKYKCIKSPRYTLYETLHLGVLKIFPPVISNDNLFSQDTDFILKISGIWENENEYGLTYKILFS